MGKRIPVTLGCLEPLATKPEQPRKIALVCEGGGQRGIFTAGVLDEFLRASFDPFDLLIGTSAGAQNLTAYVCGQVGYARQVIMQYSTSTLFFNPLRFIRGGNLVDIDWLIDQVTVRMPLNLDYALQRLASNLQFYICACRADDFSPMYFPAQKETWYQSLKASSAIPGFYRTGITIDGVSYVDGGVSGAIPVEEAYRLGADTIIVIRTVPSQIDYTPKWIKRIERFLSPGALPQMLRILHHSQQCYTRTETFIANPPPDLQIIEIYPPRPLASNVLGSSVSALNRDYYLGNRCGRYFLSTVGRALLRNSEQKTKNQSNSLAKLSSPDMLAPQEG